jgi:hypothetical protein
MKTLDDDLQRLANVQRKCALHRAVKARATALQAESRVARPYPLPDRRLPLTAQRLAAGGRISVETARRFAKDRDTLFLPAALTPDVHLGFPSRFMWGPSDLN